MILSTKKGATENFQVYWGAPLLAVATGVAVLKAVTTAKAEIGFRLGKNSMKFYVIKEDAKSKWTFLAADAMNVI